MLLIVARLRARYFREEGGLGCTREVGSVMPFGKMQNPVTFSYVLLGMQFFCPYDMSRSVQLFL